MSKKERDEENGNGEESSDDNEEFDELARQLGDLSPEERERVLKMVNDEDDEADAGPGIPKMVWAPNPETIKTTFQFVRQNGVVTWEELRQHLYEQGLTSCEKGKYTFGIVHGDGGDPFFDSNGSRQGDTELWLTSEGERLADVFEDGESGLDGIERALILGTQGFESAFAFLDLVGQHREEGIRRKDVQEELVNRYGKKGKHFTGYYRKLFGSLGMIESRDDPEDARKARYFPLYPEEPE